MPVVLLTGMSGTGTSSLLLELQRRGHPGVDTDYDGWSIPAGARAEHPEELLWDEPRMDALLALPYEPALILSGCVRNQGRFRNRIDLAVLLSAPEHVILERVRTRDANPYGRTEADRRQISADLREVEPLLRGWCDVELDATRPLPELADAVQGMLARLPR